jgi:hypothetical protein
MNLILLQNGYTIVNLKGNPKNHLKYYQALEQIQLNHAHRYLQTDPQRCWKVLEGAFGDGRVIWLYAKVAKNSFGVKTGSADFL